MAPQSNRLLWLIFGLALTLASLGCLINPTEPGENGCGEVSPEGSCEGDTLVYCSTGGTYKGRALPGTVKRLSCPTKCMQNAESARCEDECISHSVLGCFDETTLQDCNYTSPNNDNQGYYKYMRTTCPLATPRCVNGEYGYGQCVSEDMGDRDMGPTIIDLGVQDDMGGATSDMGQPMPDMGQPPVDMGQPAPDMSQPTPDMAQDMGGAQPADMGPAPSDLGM